MKINKETLKQVSLTVIAFLLIMVGYLNFNLDEKKDDIIEVSAYENEINLGDVELVNNNTENVFTNDIVPNEEMNNEISQNKDNYFEETKIERERMYSEMIETYEKIINNQETPSDQKAIAVQEITNITNIKNGIMIAENLIKNKGFDDVVIMVNNGFVNVVVEAHYLNQEQISKIQNIVERELKVETQNINISNK